MITNCCRMKSTLSLSYKSWLALRNPQVLVLLAFAVLTIASHSATAMSMDPLKRARVSSSSLIPFPRVGRSVSSSDSDSPQGTHPDTRLYFGQKRTGKSSLIPFPRVGRSGPNTWEVESETLGAASIHESKRQKLIPFPRVGKRQSLIPFPRTGKRSLEMTPFSTNGFSTDFTGHTQAEDMLIPSILQRFATHKAMLSPHEDDTDSVAPHSSELYYNNDFERANEMRKMKDNEESLALAYLYPALKSMVQRVLEDEDFAKRSY